MKASTIMKRAIVFGLILTGVIAVAGSLIGFAVAGTPGLLSALIGAGLWPAAVAFVEGITDPVQRAYAEVALHDTQEWRRDSPFLASAGAALDLSEEQLDTLFITAGGLQL